MYLLYIITLCYALNLKIGPGNVADIVIIFIFLYKYIIGKNKGSIKLQSNVVYMIFCPIIIMLCPIFVKSVFFGEDIGFAGVTIMIKLIMILIYICSFETFKFEKANYMILTCITAIPLLISILMYMIPQINDFIISVYGLSEFPVKARFGGFYGTEVNSLGFYCSTFIVFSLFLYKKEKISRKLFLTSFLLAISVTMLSGMRFGIVTLILAYLVVFLSECRCFTVKMRTRDIPKVMLTVAMIVIVGYYVFSHVLSPVIQESIIKRLSPEYLIEDFTRGGSGYLGTMSNYFSSVISNSIHPSLIFGYGLSLTFVDIGYGDMFVKYGICGILAIAVFTFYAYIYAKKDIGKRGAIFLLSFALIISLKGIFVADTKFIFMIVLLCKILKTIKNERQLKPTVELNCISCG